MSGRGVPSEGRGQGRGRLETVLRVRDLLERQALGRLAVGQQRVADAQGHLGGRMDAYRRLDKASPASAAELQAARLAGVGAHEAVQAAQADLDVAEHQRAERWTAWSQASVRRRSAERLAERRAEEARSAAERAAERETDELVAQRRARA